MFSNTFLPPGQALVSPCIWKMYWAAIGAPGSGWIEGRAGEIATGVAARNGCCRLQARFHVLSAPATLELGRSGDVRGVRLLCAQGRGGGAPLRRRLARLGARRLARRRAAAAP